MRARFLVVSGCAQSSWCDALCPCDGLLLELTSVACLSFWQGGAGAAGEGGAAATDAAPLLAGQPERKDARKLFADDDPGTTCFLQILRVSVACCRAAWCMLRGACCVQPSSCICFHCSPAASSVPRAVALPACLMASTVLLCIVFAAELEMIRSMMAGGDDKAKKDKDKDAGVVGRSSSKSVVGRPSAASVVSAPKSDGVSAIQAAPAAPAAAGAAPLAPPLAPPMSGGAAPFDAPPFDAPPLAAPFEAPPLAPPIGGGAAASASASVPAAPGAGAGAGAGGQAPAKAIALPGFARPKAAASVSVAAAAPAAAPAASR